MANNNLSFVRYVGDGVTTQFALTVMGENMGYFRTTDIHSYVDGVEVSNVINVGSPHIVNITPAPADGSDVLLRREMPVERPYSNFERGNNFGHRQVNNTFLQQLYLHQESLDGFFPEGYYVKSDVDMGGSKYINMGEGSDPSDSITFGQATELDDAQTEWNERQDDRLDAIEQGLEGGKLRYVPWAYFATGGETELYPPYNFRAVAMVVLNGDDQIPDYSWEYNAALDPTKITLAEPLEAGDEVLVRIGGEPEYLSTEVTKPFVELTANAGDSLVAGGLIFPQDNSLLSLGVQATSVIAGVTRISVNNGTPNGELLYLVGTSGDFSSQSQTITNITYDDSLKRYTVTTNTGSYLFKNKTQYKDVFQLVSQSEYDSIQNNSGLLKYEIGSLRYAYKLQGKTFVFSDLIDEIPSETVLKDLFDDINEFLSDGDIVSADVNGTYAFGEIASTAVPHIIMTKNIEIDWNYNLVTCSVDNTVDAVHVLIRIYDTAFKMKNYFFDDTSYAVGNTSKGVAFFSIDNQTKNTSGYTFTNGWTHKGRSILRAQSLHSLREFDASDINMEGYHHGEDVYYGVTASWSGNNIKGHYTIGRVNRALFIYGCDGGDVSYYCRETNLTSGALMIKQFINSRVTNWDIKAHYGTLRGPVRFSGVSPAFLDVENINIKLTVDDLSQFPNSSTIILESNDAGDAALPVGTVQLRNVDIDYDGPANITNGDIRVLTEANTADGYGRLTFNGRTAANNNKSLAAKNNMPLIRYDNSYFKYAEASDTRGLVCDVLPKFIDNTAPDISDFYVTVITKKEKSVRESDQKTERYYVRLHTGSNGFLTYIKTQLVFTANDAGFNPNTTFDIGSFNTEVLSISSDAVDATADITVYISTV